MSDSIKDGIYNAVLESILNYEYKPDQVINEKNLMERYGCSKSPVREALLSLCNENVLRNIPRYGYEVVRITREDIYDMLQFRYLLEGGMIKNSIKSLSPAQIDKLAVIDDLCQRASENVWEHWECNTNFHLQMITYADNAHAFYELQRTLAKLKRAYAQFYWNRWDTYSVPSDTKNHTNMLESLRRKNEVDFLHYLKSDLMDFGCLQCEIDEFFV